MKLDVDHSKSRFKRKCSDDFLRHQEKCGKIIVPAKSRLL